MTQKINNTSVVAIAQKNESNRNFFTKTFILLAVLAFTGFSFETKAQDKLHLDVNNNSNCSQLIKVYDGVNVIWSGSIGIGHVLGGLCYTITNLNTITSVSIQDLGSTCGAVTFTSPFTYSSQSITCSGAPPLCSSSASCSGGTGSAVCNPPDPSCDDLIIIIN